MSSSKRIEQKCTFFGVMFGIKIKTKKAHVR